MDNCFPNDAARTGTEPFSFDAFEFLDELPAPGSNSATAYTWPSFIPADLMNSSAPPACTDLMQEGSGTAGYGYHCESDLLNPNYHALLHNEMATPVYELPPGLILESKSSAYTSTDLPAAMMGSRSFISTGTSSVAAPTSYDHGAQLRQLNRAFGTSKAARPTTPKSLRVLKTKATIHNNEECGSTSVSFYVKTDDIHMDDGYRWRRYGTKPIKNEAFTKAYFECKGCRVAKWVQKCTNNPELMKFTYIGRHTHPQPE